MRTDIFRRTYGIGSFALYYKNNGSYYRVGANTNKHGAIVYSPARRISKLEYESEKIRAELKA